MRQLWLHLHAAVEARRHGPLSLQRLRPLQQNEWVEPAINKTTETDVNVQKNGPVLRQLSNQHDHFVAQKRGGRAGV